MKNRSIVWILFALFANGCATVKSVGSGSPNPGTQTTSTWLDCDSSHNADSLGINVSNLSFQALESTNLVKALQQSKVGWIRINLYWGWTERQPGIFDWSHVDNGLKALADANINALITLDGPVPCWWLPDQSPCTSPQMTAPSTSGWVSFVSAAVSRYKNQVHYWEVWNEPDLFPGLNVADPKSRLTQYRDSILIPAARAIHQADPTAKVVGPTFAAIPSGNTAPGPELTSALSLVFGNSAGDMIDVISMHSYYPDTAATKTEAIEQALATSGIGPRPIWVTEEGYGRNDEIASSDTQKDQADFLSKELGVQRAPGNPQKVFWFALTDSQNWSGQHVDDYGLIDNADYATYAWKPRAAYTTLQTVIEDACGK